jgi:site-specific recombinase XerD
VARLSPPNGFFKTLARAVKSIGMAGVHPHLLRHATGFKLVNQGVDTRTLGLPRASADRQYGAVHEDGRTAV